MFNIKQLLIYFFLPASIFAQQKNDSISKIHDTIFWKTTFHIVPQKFDTSFTIIDAENCLKNLKGTMNDNSMWVAFYESEPKKIAFVGYVDSKSKGYISNKIHKVNATGQIIIFSTSTSKNGKAFGIYQCYREGVDYVNGKRKASAEYYANGKIKNTGLYDSNEMKDGDWKYYDEKGKLIKTIKYKNGQAVN